MKTILHFLLMAALFCLPSIARAGTCNASYPNTLPQISGGGGSLTVPGQITHIEGNGTKIDFIFTPTNTSNPAQPFSLDFGASSGVSCVGSWTGARWWRGEWANGSGVSSKMIINQSSLQFIECTGIVSAGGINYLALDVIFGSGIDGITYLSAGTKPNEIYWAGYDSVHSVLRQSSYQMDGSCRVGYPAFQNPKGKVDFTNTLHLTADLSGGATSVEFFVDGVSKGSDNVAPYDITVAGLPYKSGYNIEARVTWPTGVLSAKNTFVHSPVKTTTGDSFSCATIGDGTAWCWGYNGQGQLGHTGYSAVTSDVPISVTNAGIPYGGITDISAGGDGACAVWNNGVRCWGKNSNGLLGVTSGTLASSNTPVQVIAENSGVSRVTVGGRHACALFTNGDVKCWGHGADGQLGNGSYTTTNPTPVLAATGVSKVSAGRWSTHFMIGADAWSTGDDQYGQVGNGTPYAKVNTKVKVITGGVVDIEAGPWSVCALVFSGIKCWGGNAYGELGRGTTSSGEASPDWAHEWDAWTISKLALGDGNTCAILNSSGLAKCIGYNGEGQLGVNYTSSEEIHPVTPNGFSAGVLQVSLGYHNMCALDSGHIRCAGDNTYDQIGSTSPLVNNPQLFPFTVQGF